MTVVYDSGIYLLEIFLPITSDIMVGKKGRFKIPAGYYYYIGTAQRNLKKRLERHLRKNKKKHWHIDYLLTEAEVKKYYTWPFERAVECLLANYIKVEIGGKIIIPGFGASDCNCASHLFYFKKPIKAKEIQEIEQLRLKKFKE